MLGLLLALAIAAAYPRAAYAEEACAACACQGPYETQSECETTEGGPCSPCLYLSFGPGPDCNAWCAGGGGGGAPDFPEGTGGWLMALLGSLALFAYYRRQRKPGGGVAP